MLPYIREVISGFIVGFTCGVVFMILTATCEPDTNSPLEKCAKENNVYRCELQAVPLGVKVERVELLPPPALEGE